MSRKFRAFGERKRSAVAALLAFAALLVAHAGSARAQESVPNQGANVLQQGVKQGAKLLGFATDVDPPADFVAKSRPAQDPDFIPLFQPPPEPERKALKNDELKAMKSDLDAVQKQHDTIRGAQPPAAKALANQPAAKKTPKANAAATQQ